MKPLEEDVDADQPQDVQTVISSHLRRIATSTNCGYFEVLLQRRLHRLTSISLLKHDSVREGNHIPLVIFTFVISKKVASHTWNRSEYEAASRFLDDIERQIDRPSLPSWVWEMARMFIAMELNRPPPAAGAIQNSSMAGGFREDLTSYDFVWMQMRKRFETSKLTMMVRALHGGRSKLLSIESHPPVISRSDSHDDEGFLSPSNAVTPRQLVIEKLHVPTEEFFECVKPLLVGVSSHLFNEVNGEFGMPLGLCTDATPPHLMVVCCKTLRRGGELFLKLTQLTECYHYCSTSASMSVTIPNFMLDYRNFVSSLSPSRSLLELCLEITPYIDQVEYLVKLLGSDLSGWRLLEQLHNDFLQMVDPKLSILAAALFTGCYSTYLHFIENWIYNGVWHQELFFKKHLELDDIKDRYTWNHSYSFDPQDAPSFIPAAKIYECGKLALLFGGDNTLVEGNKLTDCRPKLKLITTEDELMLLKDMCLLYSRTGDQMLLEALGKHNSNMDLVVAAREKTVADLEIELENMISTFPLRMDLGEQYFRNEERFGKDSPAIIEHRPSSPSPSPNDETSKATTCSSQSSLVDTTSVKTYTSSSTSDADSEISSSVYLFSCYEGPPLKEQSSHPCESPAGNVSSEDIIEIGEQYSTASGGSHIDSIDSPNTDSRPSTASLNEPLERQQEIDRLVQCLLRGDPGEIDEQHSTTMDSIRMSDLTHVSSEDIIEIGEKYSTASGGSHIDSIDSPNTDSRPSTASTNEALERQQEIDRLVQCLLKGDPGEIDEQPSTTMDSIRMSNICDLPSTSWTCESSKIQEELKKMMEIPSTSKSPVPPNESQIQPMDMIVDRINQNLSQNALTDVFKPLQYITNYFTRDAAQNSMEPPEKSPEKENLSMNIVDKTLLDYLISESIDYPLDARMEVAEKLAVRKMFVENDLIGRLISLRDVFLKNDGVGGRAYVSMLAKQIETDDPQAFSVHKKLQHIVNEAYPQNSRFFSLKADNLPRVFDSSNPDIFGCLKLVYKVEWPLNLVITEMALLKYQEMSEFLLKIDFTLLHLNNVFNVLRLKNLNVVSEDLTQISLHRHKMHSFVNSLKCFTGYVITDCWKKMHDKLLNAQDPDYIYNTHEDFLQVLHTELLLRKNTELFQECLCKILHFIIVYCQTVINNDFQMSSAGLPYHPRSKELIHAFSDFQEMAAVCKKILDYFVKEHGFMYLTILSQMMDI